MPPGRSERLCKKVSARFRVLFLVSALLGLAFILADVFFPSKWWDAAFHAWLIVAVGTYSVFAYVANRNYRG